MHLLGQQDGLAAGRGAQVDDRFSGLCVHAERRQLAGLPFHMEVPLPEQLIFRRAALEADQHTARHNAPLCFLCAGSQQLCTKLIGAAFQRVRPQAGHAAVGLVGKDIQCFVRVVFVQKFRHIPPGRAKHHEPLHFVFEACGAQVVAARLAQHGVDQTGCAGFFEGTGQLDGFVHRSGYRHLHIAGLRQRRAQYFAHRCIQLGKALGQELAQDVVQRAPVFQHRVKDGAGKSFIAAFQLLALEFGIQNKVGKTILLLPHQCRHCRRAGIRRHQRISPVFRR